jgi:predicted RNA-binding protein with PUA-like domain
VKSYWLVKSEPSSYSWANLVTDGKTAWTGVRNFTARNNLRAMRKGDAVFFYHSVTDKAVQGIAKVVREAYPDPTAKEGDWSAVDLSPEKPLARPVTLEEIKRNPKLKEMALLRLSRLSVQPVTNPQFDEIVRMGEHQRRFTDIERRSARSTQ